MYFRPFIFFSVLHDSNNAEPRFATFELVQDNFYTIGQFSGFSKFEHCMITIVWFDFEYQKTYKYEQEIKTIDGLSNIYFMVVTQGICCVWAVGNNETITYHNLNCVDILFQYDLESESQIRENLSSYNNVRNKLSNKSNEFYMNTLSLMRKYNFRYVPICECACEIDLTDIDQTLADGSVYRLGDNQLFDYQNASLPNKIGVKWVLNECEYNAYYWFNIESLLSLCERFYGAHPETKTDFIIRIDAENKKYELALYRQGLKEPVKIPESAYQLIVFKNKFEDYRSENYNQPCGAWIW